MRNTCARRPLRQRVIALVAAYAIALASLLAGFGAAQAAVEAQPEAGAVLAFSCAARLAVCGSRIGEEAAAIQAAANVPTFGFYTYGEFARTVGTLGVHNATITALAL